jgi:Arc/MetJ-type ribon-helix-helix transcriptional regulator
MSIEINPETERLVREEIASGHFRSVDDLIVAGLHAWKVINVASFERVAQDDDQAAARRKAGEAIRELRKGVTLDRPKGMSLREYAHIGHKY